MVCYVLVAQLCLTVTPWTVARQAPVSMRFSRQEYWSGLHFLLQGDLPNPGIEPRSPALEVDSLLSAPPGKPIESIQYRLINVHVIWASLTSLVFFFCLVSIDIKLKTDLQWAGGCSECAASQSDETTVPDSI